MQFLPNSLPYFQRCCGILITLYANLHEQLNWSSPTDARWASSRLGPDALRCESFQEIALLLKASNKIAFDLQEAEAAGGAAAPVLVLRRWARLHRSMEFRIFVSEGRITGDIVRVV